MAGRATSDFLARVGGGLKVTEPPCLPAMLHNLRNIALGRLFAGSLLQTLVLRSKWRLFNVKSAKLRNTAVYQKIFI